MQRKQGLGLACFYLAQAAFCLQNLDRRVHFFVEGINEHQGFTLHGHGTDHLDFWIFFVDSFVAFMEFGFVTGSRQSREVKCAADMGNSILVYGL